MVWLSSLLPYKQCQAVFERIGQVHMPSSIIWRAMQTYDVQICDYIDQRQAQVAIERIVLAGADQDHAVLKGVSIDGSMVNLRGEG